MGVMPLELDGLNLILGGGVPLIRRAEDLDESATLLFRGPPGSGKTVLGTQLAGMMARRLGADVVYGCIEILPSELDAQHAGLKAEGIPERVVPAPFPRREAAPRVPDLRGDAGHRRAR